MILVFGTSVYRDCAHPIHWLLPRGAEVAVGVLANVWYVFDHLEFAKVSCMIVCVDYERPPFGAIVLRIATNFHASIKGLCCRKIRSESVFVTDFATDFATDNGIIIVLSTTTYGCHLISWRCVWMCTTIFAIGRARKPESSDGREHEAEHGLDGGLDSGLGSGLGSGLEIFSLSQRRGRRFRKGLGC